MGNTSTWRRHSELLAKWAWQHLVNREDVWGAFLPLAERGKVQSNGVKMEKSWTAPAKRKRGQISLTLSRLRWHFDGLAVQNVIGLHSTSPDNTSRWGAVDIDWHGPTSTCAAINLKAAIAWYERLRGLGFKPLLTESNGTGGYHLRLIFNTPVSTAKVYALLQWLIRDYASYGMAAPPETFPKQPAIKPGGYGNWLRLPGRHHTTEYRSRVWDGSNWLDDEAAVKSILAMRGDTPDLIPAEAAISGPKKGQGLVRGRRWTIGDNGDEYPGGFCRENLDAAGVLDDLPGRIAKYMAKLPNLAEAQGRDDVGFGFACFLVRDMQLSKDDAMTWLRTWDSGNNPPKGEDCCAKWESNARTYGRHPYGCGLIARPRIKQRKAVRFAVEVPS